MRMEKGGLEGGDEGMWLVEGVKEGVRIFAGEGKGDRGVGGDEKVRAGAIRVVRGEEGRVQGCGVEEGIMGVGE